MLCQIGPQSAFARAALPQSQATHAGAGRHSLPREVVHGRFSVHATDGKTCMERLAKEVTTFRDIIIQAGIKKL
jgi:hypothetical protein